jgi:hypothetical protein
MNVSLESVERVEMVTPGSPAPLPEGGRDSGTWLEVRNDEDQVVFHRVLHNPFRTLAEHHSPEGGIEVVERPVGRGRFVVLVPASPDAARAVLWTSPPELDRAGEPAEIVLDEDLPREDETSA